MWIAFFVLLKQQNKRTRLITVLQFRETSKSLMLYLIYCHLFLSFVVHNVCPIHAKITAPTPALIEDESFALLGF
jgi:hypothetical protein